MKRNFLSLAVSTLGAILFAAACGPSAVMKPRARDTAPTDTWKRSAIWLYATANAPSGQGPECKHVRQMLPGEAGCQGALCKQPAELADEWLNKCAKLVPDGVEAISDLQAELSDRSDKPPSECAKDLARFVDDGCAAEHCVADAQAWATRCGQTEGSPLTVSILAKVVSRHVNADKPIELDARSCETLTAQVETGSKCKTEKVCKDAWKVLKTQKERCSAPDAVPDIISAMRELSIAIGAVREVDDGAVVADEPEVLGQDALPLVLANGKGAVFSVCHQRVTSLDEYLEERSKCNGGFVHLAQAMIKHADRVILLGEVPVREGWDVLDMFPSFAVTGEKSRVEKKSEAAFVAAIDAAIGAGGGEGLAKLATAIDEHGARIFEDAQLRKVLGARDEKLVPLFALAGTLKLSKGKTLGADALRGFGFRAKTRPLADVSRAGKVEAGTPTRGAWLVTTALLPKATEAYDSKIAALLKHTSRQPPLLSMVGARAAKKARSAAQQCQRAQTAEAKARADLAACVFDDCDDDDIQSFLDTRDQAAADASAQQHALLLAVSSVESDQLDAIASAANCKLPTLD